MTPSWTALFLLACLLLATRATDLTTLNSAGQSIHDIKGGAATTITKKGNPLLMLMEPALPALKYMLPLMALLALPELLSSALSGLRGVAGFGQGYGVQARGRRSAPVDFVEGAQQMMSLLSRLDEAVQKYGSQEAACQLRAMCELHRGGMSPEAGVIAKNLISLLKVESRVERSTMPDDQKTALRDFLRAAQHGLHHRNCTQIYSGDCPDTTS